MTSDRRFASIVAALCILAFSSEATAGPGTATLTVRGKVVSPDGQPIGHARVFVVHRPQYHDFVITQRITDESGEFEVSNVPVGVRIRFAVRHDGSALSLLQRIFLNPVQTEPLEIIVTPADTITMRVEDPSGRPLHGAAPGRLLWTGPNGNSYLEHRLAGLMGVTGPLSDSSGRLRLTWLPKAATVTGHICHPQFARSAFKATVGGNASIIVKLKKGTPFKLNVVGKGIDVPTKGWQLSMGNDSSVFNDHQLVLNEQAEFGTVVPTGRYTILLRHPILQTIPGIITDRTIEGDELQRVEFAVTPRGKVTGRVISAESGEPVADQMVQAYVYSADHPKDHYGLGPGWFYSARAITDQFGNYTINPGTGPVRLIHRSRQWACEKPFVAADVSDAQQSTAPDIRLRDGITLTGLVTDPQGNPVPRAVVQPSGAQAYRHPVICDTAGRFEYQVEDITTNSPGNTTGYIELLIFDPYRPLSHQLKVPLDTNSPSVEIPISLETIPISAPPTPSSSPTGESSLVAKLAPELSIAREFNNSAVSTRIADHRGKFVLLHFWATWCGPCLQAMPTIELAHELYSDHGLVVIGVHHNSVAADAVEKFLNDQPSNHINIVDAKNGATCKQYHVDAFPGYFLIGPDGKVVMTSIEDRENLSHNLIKSLRQFLNRNGDFAEAIVR